jgi:hypothetical protein
MLVSMIIRVAEKAFIERAEVKVEVGCGKVPVLQL